VRGANAASDEVIGRLEAMLGAGSVAADLSSRETYAVDEIAPAAVVKPETVEQVEAIIAVAISEKLAVIPRGHGTKMGMGMPPERYDLALEMTGLRQIAYYDPDDLTLSVDAGMDLSALAETLAEHRQFLPLAVPFFGESTVGGAVASGISSSLREGYGTARDFLLGAEFVSGSGALTKSGGRVVKNVSGYDLHKLLIGSLGTLAAITRLNFRTYPAPQGYGELVAAFSTIEDLLQFSSLVRKSPLSPSSFQILSPTAARATAKFKEDRGTPMPEWFGDGLWHACVLFEGADPVIQRYSTDLVRHAQQAGVSAFSVLDSAKTKALSAALRELLSAHVSAGPAATIFRMDALPVFSAGILRLQELASKLACPCSIFGNASGPLYFTVNPAVSNEQTISSLAQICAEVFEYAASRQGEASIPFCPTELKRLVNVWGPARKDAQMMRRVKKAFDPENIFAPGRFVAGI
jgi:glycolate oxidase FAD binding subunit